MYSVKVNGSLCGYFKGARGLRQGDPLSPYLFVIIMEALSMLLRKKTLTPGFKFHWRTDTCKISHLCFADDLLLFSAGNVQSVGSLQHCLSVFSNFSGLIPNPSKSQCYFANVPLQTQCTILTTLGFSKGAPPIKFLGVPLITSKLSFNDCIPLIQKITARVSSWANKPLSYTGRIQLIKSVLFAIQSYWSSHFILPQKVVKEIQSILSRFLWKGTSLAQHGAKVAWDAITKPYNEGGLGIKSISEWNRALILYQLWQIVHPLSHSLWVKWVKSTVLKSHSFWIFKAPSDCSWIWRKVLNLRSFAINFIHYNIGDGCDTSLWFDPWHRGRPLASSLQSPLISNARLSSLATVSSIIHAGTWSLPNSNHQDVISFRDRFDFSTPIRSGRDSITWAGFPFSKVKAAIIWNSTRASNPLVNWYKIVWPKLQVPRFSFILWLAFLKRLNTFEVISSYDPRLNPICRLCTTSDETFYHLFFECAYSQDICRDVLSQLGWTSSYSNWHAFTIWIHQCAMGKIFASILKLSFATIVYKLWTERNTRIFAGTCVPSYALSKDILDLIRCRLHSSAAFHKALSRQPRLSFWTL